MKEVNKMEEKGVLNKEEYERITRYYMKSKNIARIFKEKCAILAADGNANIINLLSNSQKHMSYFSGHICLFYVYAESNIILGSGSSDKGIKIWNMELRTIISTLSGHRNIISALLCASEGFS